MAKEKPENLYFTWNTDEDDEESHYFEQFDSIEDAVTSNAEDQVEVYVADIKRLGVFEQKRSIVKVREQKKKAKG